LWRFTVFESWKIENIDGFYLSDYRMGLNKINDKSKRLILAANKEKLINSDNELFNNRGAELETFKLPLFVNKSISKLLNVWIFFYISNVILTHLYRTRDRLSQFSFPEFEKEDENIKNLEKEFTWMESIIPHFINDVEKNNSYINHVESSFTLTPLVKERENNFLSLTQNYLESNLESINREYENLNNRYYSNINLFSALNNKKISDQNLNIQKRVLWITIAMLIINIIMLALNFERVSSSVLNIIESIF